jgi:lipoate-protein ligase A
MLQVLDTGIQAASHNMQQDKVLLDKLEKPTLHLYRWAKKSATYGYFIQPEAHLDLKKVEEFGLELARRPTGGGIVFHIWDLAFSFLLPATHPAFSLNTLENYYFVNDIVLDVVKSYFSLDELILTPEHGISHGPDCQNFCMAKPTQYDVLYRGMKVAGSAQRRKTQGYLHQGTISLGSPDLELLRGVLLSHRDVVEAMKAYTFSPLGNNPLEKTRKDLEKLLERKLEIALES